MAERMSDVEKGLQIASVLTGPTGLVEQLSNQHTENAVFIFNGILAEKDPTKRAAVCTAILRKIDPAARRYEDLDFLIKGCEFQGQKDEAVLLKRKRDFLVTSVALALTYQGGSGVTRKDMDDAVHSGLSSMIKPFLPNEFMGMSEAIARRYVGETVAGVLKEVDQKMMDIPPFLPSKIKTEKQIPILDEALDRLADEYRTLTHSQQNKETSKFELACGYLYTMKEERERQLGGINQVGLGRGVNQGNVDLATMMAMTASGGAPKEGQGGGINLALMEAMRNSSLTSLDTSSVSDWVTKMTSVVVASRVFWSGQWPQLATAIDTELARVRDQTGASATEYSKARKIAVAIVTVNVYERAIYASDESLANFAALVPPPGEMSAVGDYLWSGGCREALLNDEIVKASYTDFFRRAYGDNFGGGPVNGDLIKQAIKAMGSEEEMDIAVENIVRVLGLDQKTDRATAIKKTRLAISLFVVDDYPRWTAWLMSNISKKKFEFDWIKREELFEKRKVKTGSSKTDWVETWRSNIKMRTMVNHPFLAMIRPVDVLRGKNVFGEDILVPLEKTFKLLRAEKWQSRRGTRGNNPRDQEFPRLSEIGGKDIMRYAKAWAGIIGNTSGDQLESLDKFIDGATEVFNMFTDGVDKKEVAGAVLSLALAVKVDAMLASGGGFLDNMLGFAMMLGEFNKEQMMQITTMYGSDMAKYGQIRELLVRFGANLNTKELRLARMKILTSVRSSKFAPIAYILKTGFAVADTAMAVGGMFGAPTQKKR